MIREGIGAIVMAFALGTAAKAELIVLAAPGSDDSYYADVANDIFDFHVDYARQILEAGDDVVILADPGFAPDYASALGAQHVSTRPQLDIWARDFGTVNPERPLMFRYTAAGQGGGRSGQRDADAVQDVLAVTTDQARFGLLETDLLNDGGNYVDDGFGRAVLSRKFLRDNRLSESRARTALKELLGLDYVAFIESDEQGGLEHADGVVAFIDENTLIVNSYPEDQRYQADLEADLRAGLPGVTIHRIVTPYDGSQIYDERFGSACGLYTNALVTPNRIYLPQFGIPEDAQALQQVQALTRKTVVPVPSGQVCHMGGGVRCMSWQLRGQSASKVAAILRR